MKQEMKKYTVTIVGQTYTLLGDESEVDVIRAASKVDSFMKEIVQKSSHTNNNYNGAVLAALKLALQVVALESEQENGTQALKKLIDYIDYEKAMLTSHR